MTDASLLDLNAVRERWLDKDWQREQALLQRNIDEMWLARDIYDLITECEQNRKALKAAISERDEARVTAVTLGSEVQWLRVLLRKVKP